MRGFVFSLIFIIVFATMLASIPAGLQGTGSTPDTVVPVDPSLVTGFSDINNWTRASYTLNAYEYTLGGRDWGTGHDDVDVVLFAKVKLFGFLWLGAVDVCKFISVDGVDRGTELSFTEIDADDTDGSHRYDLRYTGNGDSAGKLVIYWNTTEYPDLNDAWIANELHLLHGMGIDDTATANIGALIVSLLLLQLPNVPVLVNMFLATPIWACIVYVLWYVIKEMIPFL
jgi:hypothetical protein